MLGKNIAIKGIFTTILFITIGISQVSLTIENVNTSITPGCTNSLYTTESEWERKNPNDRYPANIAEIIVAKHRNGPTGTIPLYFRNDVVTFESLDTRTESITSNQ